ncbi:hypothetical protein JNW91_12010 [Micromonospora sp. STR1_7]|uniref:Acetyl-CoA C-acyltransferase n=1 Tax=Micromonospora parastrephiae TaxID=2806101 RepID=A0ABS1XTN4_9ACTN|nr:hypothetical protein [Micromonospora parastrephiae]MBM0232524.1 hypothetical protein [Micromonospora parastrephiae]
MPSEAYVYDAVRTPRGRGRDRHGDRFTPPDDLADRLAVRPAEPVCVA